MCNNNNHRRRDQKLDRELGNTERVGEGKRGENCIKKYLYEILKNNLKIVMAK